jgi:formylglycine-generating enzyme required for sulfatase activity
MMRTDRRWVAAAVTALLVGGCEVFLSDRGSAGHRCLPGELPCAEGLVCAEDGICRAECITDGDCDDDRTCTIDSCSGGACQHTAVPSDKPCDDGLYCTTDDRCKGGVCLGGQRDCSGLSDACNVGFCDEDQDACQGSAKADGSACDDGMYCTEHDRCLAGECRGDARDCSAYEDACNTAVCDEQNQRCAVQPVADGNACDDGDACTTGDRCLQGQCRGDPKDDDGDGFVDAACGGLDCNDGEIAVNPDSAEGPRGEASCSDGLDNDCRRGADDVDPACNLTWIPLAAGTFEMGSESAAAQEDEQPVHTVELPAFEMTASVITNAQYKPCVDAGDCVAPSTWHPKCTWSANGLRPDHPVNCLSWYQARDFCEQWVGNGARLPSEAEWEYAARSGGLNITYPWGDEPATCDRAVMNDGGFGCGENSVWPVCSRPDGNTDQGLCDMAGNVWEWVQDWYHEDYVDAPTNGSAWISPPGNQRVVRGAEFTDDAQKLRAHNRWRAAPIDEQAGEEPAFGFRCAR